ncbi:DUF2911 family protein [Roseivirga ehrenbergii]|uniref:DUF2911 domain-containing protein n=1 Tax=Roseivirga ehrenbergii (strain DSM 102268 / JCM 13514 / KCTC 12282 / NCIMB 14502 / KMM 6017) TaxID=279360 RepID=A0A150X038_ROSEK|nr:DUF2911 domain-containing protein [Roseivirga ehrenbergii]KYG72108.1 hypothetical protein MB14_08645 [Roseivirga ehrenbergii]TCL13339.1 DUF2911 family protein [Roseivirga ehrenbergii]
MKKLLLALLVTSVIVSCKSPNTSNEAGFITLLGNDTLAVESFTKSDDLFSAKVVLRSPSISLRKYDLTFANGDFSTLEVTDYDPTQGFNGAGTLVQRMTRQQDSLIVESEGREGMTSRTVAFEKDMLPFIDMVHWPYDLAFNKAVQSPNDSINQRLWTGRSFSTFIIAKEGSDSLTIRHPSRGVMGVDILENGDIQLLDAGLTTRKLKVHRVNTVDIDKVAASFAEADRNGKTFGELSGAPEEHFEFKGVEFEVSYGSPQKRGREIFGGIVPWGQLWRTGANRATHFKTSKDLKIGDLNVPAGEYTFFTIPQPDGGTLIINKQTGQNGQSYNQDRDLGRVPMQISQQTEVTEPFTIKVEESENGGVIKLIWDQTVFSIDFVIL